MGVGAGGVDGKGKRGTRCNDGDKSEVAVRSKYGRGREMGTGAQGVQNGGRSRVVKEGGLGEEEAGLGCGSTRGGGKGRQELRRFRAVGWTRGTASAQQSLNFFFLFPCILLAGSWLRACRSGPPKRQWSPSPDAVSPKKPGRA